MDTRKRIEALEKELVQLREQLGIELPKFLPIPGHVDHNGEKVKLAKHPTTCKQYELFLEVVNIPPPPNWGGSRKCPEGMEKHPVTCVNLFEARLFAAWLGYEIQQIIDVAEDRDWLAACGSEKYPWGNASLGRSRAHYNASGTAPVDAHPDGAGPYGHEDLLGNVWEINTTPWKP